VIVFISSVRRGLEAERDHLPALLKVSGHQPSVFEDFTAQTAPSRDAVVAAAEKADVVILLLGEHYGEPLPDSGVATTEEEFLVAKRLGIPILVFRKSGVTPEDRQQEFISRAGDYVQGRFWKEFREASDLGVAVLTALREVEQRGAMLTWQPTGPVTVRWRSERRPFVERSDAYTPLLEAHLAASGGHNVLSVAALQPLQRRLVRAAREAGLFAESAGVQMDNDGSSAWATSSVEEDRGFYTPERVWRSGTSGVAVDRSGTVLVFRPLPRDTMGSLVNRASLTADLAPLLRLAAEIVPGAVGQVVPAAGIEPFDQVMEGDPQRLGRNSAGIRIRGGHPLRTEPEDSVPLAAFPAAAPEVAAELAARLMAELRTRSS
jgi:hypothetical protein